MNFECYEECSFCGYIVCRRGRRYGRELGGASYCSCGGYVESESEALALCWLK